MQGKVEQTGQTKTNTKGLPYFSVKIGNSWYSVSGTEEEKQKLSNRMISYTVTKEKQGSFNAWIKVDAVEDPPPEPTPVSSANGHGNGRLPSWDDYASIMRSAHEVALELERDTYDTSGAISVDRSMARVALVQTVLVAFRDGKIALEEDSPF